MRGKGAATRFITKGSRKMIRNLKALGPALVALAAMSAIMASSASAHKFTSTGVYPQAFIVEDVGAADQFTLGENSMECHGETHTGTLNAPTTTIEVTPEYGETCRTGNSATWNMTVTENGCKLHIEWAEHVAADHDKIKIKLVCTLGKGVEIHHYSSQPHSGSSCTNTIVPQTATGTLTATSLTPSGDILLEGSVGITQQTHGACSFGFTINQNATFDVSKAVRAVSGAAIHIE